MAVQWQFSVDYLATANLWDIGEAQWGNWASQVSALYAPLVGSSLYHPENEDEFYRRVPGGSATVWGHFRAYMTTAGTDFFAVAGDNLLHVVLSFATNGRMLAYLGYQSPQSGVTTSGATLLGSGVLSAPLGAWFAFAYEITIHDTAGVIKTWINGQPDVNLTGVDTRNGADADVKYVLFANNYWGLVCYDDIVVGTATGANATGPRDVRVDCMRPSANGTDRDWTRATALRQRVPASLMSSNVAPTPYVASASTEYSASYAAWYAFDGVTAGNYKWTAGASTGWVQMDFGSAVVVGAYAIGMNTEITRAPKDWTLQGSNNGSSFDTLDTRTGETGWAGVGETREYTVASPASYRYYRLNVTLNNGDTYVQVNELSFYEYLTPGSDDFALLNENVTNDDKYLTTNTNGARMSVRVAPLTNAGGTIVAVQVTVHATKTVVGPCGFKIYMLSNGTRYYSDEFFPSVGSWEYFEKVWDQHLYPSAEAWTEADFNACEFGVERTT